MSLRVTVKVNSLVLSAAASLTSTLLSSRSPVSYVFVAVTVAFSGAQLVISLPSAPFETVTVMIFGAVS